MEYDRHNFLSFWAIFCSFTSLSARKIKIKKKKREKCLEICYTVPEIWRMMDVIIFHFLLFYTPLASQKIKIKKKKTKKQKKNAWRYHRFTEVYQKS